MGSWPILGESVAVRLDRQLRAATGSARDLDGAIVAGDDVATSEDAVRAWLAALPRGVSVPHVAALGDGVLTRRLRGRALRTLPSGALPVPLLYVPAGAELPVDHPALMRLCEDAVPVIVDPQERCDSVPAPRAFCDPGKDKLELWSTPRPLLHLRHRTHLLQANLDALSLSLQSLLATPRWRLALRLLLDRLRLGRGRVLSRVGRGAKVHPTAIVEASVVGDGAEIGAFAIVRGSFVGAGAVVEDAAHVTFAAVGPGARVARQCAVFASVLQEGAHGAQQVMQFSVLGRDAIATSASWFTDVRFDKELRVEAEGALVPFGSRFLGCDVGHRCIVGAGVIVAPGRMLPSNATILGNTAQVLSRAPAGIDPSDGGGASFAVSDGTLRPLVPRS